VAERWGLNPAVSFELGVCASAHPFLYGEKKEKRMKNLRCETASYTLS
jgi:hypothetical protein